MGQTELLLYGNPIESVFELIGTRENDVTYSIGCALSRSPVLLSRLLTRVFPDRPGLEVESVYLQHRSESGGYTDIELLGRDPGVHVIIEAKRGWWLPEVDQLERYASRLRRSGVENQALVVMAECSREYADMRLKWPDGPFRRAYFSWRDIANLADIREGTLAERRLCQELRVYLGRVIKMQNVQSNMVYVVALASGTPDWSDISWIEIVENRRRYFHPVGDGWPKEPVNYIGFRYGGRLQSIHHVDDYLVVNSAEEMRVNLPGVTRWSGDKPHFLYVLGEPIRPAKVVKTGKIFRNQRVKAMIDLLLTSDSISEARDLTNLRLRPNSEEEQGR